MNSPQINYLHQKLDGVTLVSEMVENYKGIVLVSRLFEVEGESQFKFKISLTVYGAHEFELGERYYKEDVNKEFLSFQQYSAISEMKLFVDRGGF